MEQSSCRPITVLWFYLWLLRITNVQCTHGQIFYKKIEFSLNISYDPENHIYPVIDLQKSSCPFIPMSFCNNNDAYWKLFKEGCHPSCPNGTRVQCVENNENNQFKHLLLVCAPIGNCSTDARNIVYFDENKPDRYQLGQMKCEDGHYHQRSVICFGECERDNSIVVLQEATLTSRAIVHCNYKYDFCNPEKPKLFELSSEPNVCLYRQYPRCRFGMERLPDCSCKMSCPDKRYYREPYNDFRCKKKSSIILVSTTNTQLLKVNAQLRPFSTGLRLSYSFSSERDISPKILKIIYRKIGSHRALALPDRELSDNVSRKHVDIESLYAGQTYLLTITLLFEHVDKMRNYTISMTGTVQPRPVINLTSISYDKKKSIELSWKAPLKSKQDSYRIEHRMEKESETCLVQ